MKAILLAAAALAVAISPPAKAAPVDDAVHAVTIWLDKFNAGDMNAFYAGHAPNAVLVDEFAPYIWSGPNAPRVWAKAFGKDAAKQAISDPRMDYAAPLRATSDGRSAYIVLPTTYHIKRRGRPMSAAGSMTFVMVHQAAGWKIASWTYSAPAPAPDR